MSSDVVQGVNRSWAETPPVNPPLRHAIGEVVERQTWLDKLANPVQNWLLAFFGQPGQPNRKMKDMLNGTWLGHSLHPVLTDVPLGAWSGTMLLDLVWFSNEDEGIARGSDLTLLLGMLGATGAAVTGVTDWSDLDGTDRRGGFLHGLMNGSILLTNNASWEVGSDDYVAVMNAQYLAEGKLTRVDAAGIAAVLLKQGNSIYAIGATCTHMGDPLDKGTYKDGTVTCPWHGSCFRMSDGAVVNG